MGACARTLVCEWMCLELGLDVREQEIWLLRPNGEPRCDVIEEAEQWQHSPVLLFVALQLGIACMSYLAFFIDIDDAHFACMLSVC